MRLDLLLDKCKEAGGILSKKLLANLTDEEFKVAAGCLDAKYVAWKFFLPFSTSDTIVLFESRLGLETVELAKDVFRVLVVCRNFVEAEIIKQRVSAESLKNVLVIIARPSSLPIKDCCVDSVCASNIKKIFHKYEKETFKFKNLIHSIRKAAKPDGFLFLGADLCQNNSTSRSIRKRVKWLRDAGEIKENIENCGLITTKDFYFLPEWNRPNEIRFCSEFKLPTSVSGLRDLFSGIIREIIPALVASGRGWMIENCHLVSGLNYNYVIENILNSIARSQKNVKSTEIEIEQVLLCNPNVLLISVNCRERSFIVRMGLDRVSAERVSKHAKAINAIIHNYPEWREFVPEQVGIVTVERYEAHIEEKIKLAYQRFPHKVKPKQEELCLDWITKFHLATKRVEILTLEKFSKYIGQYINYLNKWLSPRYYELASRLEEYIADALIDREFPIVFQHGDFKIENIFFVKGFSEISSVIDWDLSSPEGLPLIDLLYFANYNSLSKAGADIVKELCFSPQRISTLVERLPSKISEYINLFELNEIDIHCLAIICWLHHVFERIGSNYKLRDVWLRENIADVLEKVCSVI